MPNIATFRQVLTNGNARRVRVSLPGIGSRITPAAFSNIAGRLVLPNRHVRGTIAVEVDSRLGTLARYQFRLNKLFVPNDTFPASPTQEALVVHEAVHAYHDVISRGLQWDSDEMLAYVAGMAYLIRRQPNLLNHLPSIRNNLLVASRQCTTAPTFHACDMAVTGWALLIAVRLRSGQTPTRAQMNGLRQSILNHVAYSSLGRTPRGRATRRGYNGV